jgi:hypothetical protein
MHCTDVDTRHCPGVGALLCIGVDFLHWCLHWSRPWGVRLGLLARIRAATRPGLDLPLHGERMGA